jgi:cytoskeletal protein RodZ
MEEPGHRDYRSLGEILRDARVAQGKSLQDLAELTKIAPKSIVALEADDFDRLAGPVYVRSFTKTLAEALSLDVQFLLTKLSQASSAMGSDPTAQVKPIIAAPRSTRVVRHPSTRLDTPAKKDETTWHVEKVRVTRIASSESGSQGLRWMLIVSAIVFVAAVLIILVQRRSTDSTLTGDVGLRQSSLVDPTPVALADADGLDAEPPVESKEAAAETASGAKATQPATGGRQQEEIVPPQQIRTVASNAGGAGAAPEPKPRDERPRAVEPNASQKADESTSPGASSAGVAEHEVESEETPKDVVQHEEVSDLSSGNLGSILRPDDSAATRPMRRLHLSASEDVEIWVASDGDEPARHLLRRGASVTVEGRDHFSLRLEDPASVVVVVDGVRHDPPAGLIGEWIIWADDDKQ